MDQILIEIYWKCYVYHPNDEIHWNDKNFVSSELIKNSEYFQYASYNIRNDQKYILKIIKESSSSDCLKYVSPELQNNENFMLKCIKYNPNSIIHASKNLQTDLEFLERAEAKNHYSIVILNAKN